MNSVLQQLFMTTELRREMCAARLPTRLRTSGGTYAKGAELVGKKISVQWDNGISYDAIVEGFDSATGMHTIRYCPIPLATVGSAGHQHVHLEEVTKMPPEFSEEFFLSEGRPGKETGVFEIVEERSLAAAGEITSERRRTELGDNDELKETVDEIASRHLLEEVQRTFIHLDKGSRGRCFDPRALVEACTCLKLEFDVWQQNDASEFAMKLLDRMEIALRRWAPEQFRYLDHTFGLKQTKQKVCKECGLKVSFLACRVSQRANGAYPGHFVVLSRLIGKRT
jgi:ubiquitin carboxyl-terminal hydrolase 9/24